MSAIAPIHLVSQAEELLVLAVEKLSNATTLAQVVDAGDLARVVRECLELRDKGSAAHAAAYETVILANARAGEYTRRLPQAKRGPKSTEVVIPDGGENLPSKTEALKSLGLTSQDVSRFEALADLAPEERRARIDAGKAAIIAGKRPPEITAVTSGSKHDGDMFSSPAVYVEPARELMEGIELDPASNESAQKVVRATRYFTKETDGLAAPWRARSIWLNPPYSRGEMKKWVDHLLEAKHAESGAFVHATVLTNTDNSAGWWKSLARACTVFCLASKRIAFELDGTPVKGNSHPQTIFYFGPKLPGFARLYDPLGLITIVYRGRKRAGGSEE